MEPHVAMISALVIMLAAVATKMATAYLMNRMRLVISSVQEERARVLGNLHKAKNQRALIERNKQSLLQKKMRMQKKIYRYRRDLKEVAQDQLRRDRVKENKKLKLAS